MKKPPGRNSLELVELFSRNKFSLVSLCFPLTVNLSASLNGTMFDGREIEVRMDRG